MQVLWLFSGILMLATTASAQDWQIVIHYGDDAKAQVTRTVVGPLMRIPEPDIIPPTHVSFSGPEGVSFRVEQQTETSLTLMEEGPHLDLVRWRHGYSAWTSLVAEEGGRMKIAEQKTIFPRFTQEELFAAVRSEISANKAQPPQATDRWLGVAKLCKGSEYPCGVSPSRMIFRLSVREGERWVEKALILLGVAMGC